MGLLAESLRFAVPMWEMEMAGWSKDTLKRVSSETAQKVMECGDDLMFKNKTIKGRQSTRDTFNAMAQGLACLCLLIPDFDLKGYLDKLGDHEDEFRRSP